MMSKIVHERWQCDRCHKSVNVKASSPYIPYCDECEQDRFLVNVVRESKRKPRFTSSSLKALYEGNKDNGRALYFDRITMDFCGDTMKNYGVRKVQARAAGYHTDPPFEAWQLYRIKPVRSGMQDNAYFSLEGLRLVGVHEFHPE